LTQNVVDGLGPTGTDGLFTTASETTLAVLRQNSGALLTILSAVVSDPLYSWSMSPVKARERQALLNRDEDEVEVGNNDEAEGTRRRAAALDASAAWSKGSSDNDFGVADQNEAAAAAISKIKEKLQGYEDGTSGEQQSIRSQIQLLIQMARDPDKLCEMFHGWSAWV
jgi:ataxia telangiectasia mutated family protein